MLSLSSRPDQRVHPVDGIVDCLVVGVDDVPRAPNGEADYKSAQKAAIAAAADTGSPTIHQ